MSSGEQVLSADSRWYPGALTAALAARKNQRRSPRAYGAWRFPGISLFCCGLAQREVLREARELRDLTATLMGDPPPGFRALDRR